MDDDGIPHVYQQDIEKQWDNLLVKLVQNDPGYTARDVANLDVMWQTRDGIKCNCESDCECEEIYNKDINYLNSAIQEVLQEALLEPLQ